MNNILSIFFSLFFWLFISSTVALVWSIAFVVWIVTLPFDKRRKILHKFSCLWALTYLKLAPAWKITTSGEELVDDNKSYVYVGNHQSMIDILVVFGIKKHFKWVSKRSLFAVPFIGWNMWMNNHVGLSRGKAKSIKKMFADCGKHLDSGSSVFLFPEGTRSKDGQLRKFKNGAFKLATDHNVCVVPVVIDGVRDALEKDSWIINGLTKIHISINILPPIDPAEFNGDSKKLHDATREIMKNKLNEIRNEE